MRDTVSVETRYPALSTIAGILKFIAALIAIAGVVMAVLALKNETVGLAMGMGLGTAVSVLLVWASAESISVLVDIEANTRATALANQRSTQPSDTISANPLIPLPASAGPAKGYLENLGYRVVWTGSRFVITHPDERGELYAYSSEDLKEQARMLARRHGAEFKDAT